MITSCIGHSFLLRLISYILKLNITLISVCKMADFLVYIIGLDQALSLARNLERPENGANRF